MNLIRAYFRFAHQTYVVNVTFGGDTVTVCWGVQRRDFANRAGKYKPCVTHAKKLAAMAMGQKAKRGET